ncbi:hypothetical protein J6590_074352 [Homalodisca vitripennis]|nr:hypothetical protein J6590_074352 [Homalodisca vitripennis]
MIAFPGKKTPRRSLSAVSVIAEYLSAVRRQELQEPACYDFRLRNKHSSSWVSIFSVRVRRCVTLRCYRPGAVYCMLHRHRQHCHGVWPALAQAVGCGVIWHVRFTTTLLITEFPPPAVSAEPRVLFLSWSQVFSRLEVETEVG